MNPVHVRRGARVTALVVTSGSLFLFGRAVLTGDPIDGVSVLLGVLITTVVIGFALLGEVGYGNRAEMQLLRAEISQFRRELLCREVSAEAVAARAMLAMTGTDDGRMAVGEDTGTHNVTRFRPR